MKNFIKKYGYLIYFIIMVCLFTSKVVIIGPLILEYLIRLSEKAHEEEFIKKYAWAFFMGMITSIYGISILSYKYFILNIIALILVWIRKDIK